jgi:DNA-binding NtrC family response regulator/tetratricopeptide (TPR) repeat protein
MQLVADRFVVDRNESDERLAMDPAIDLATGARVVLKIGSAGGVSEQTRWTLRCDGLHRLHHRSIAPLLDFGMVGESSRFEAWRCGGTWQGSPDVARAVHARADHFFRSSGLTTSASGPGAVRIGSTGAVLLPDAGTGYRSDAGPTVEAITLDTAGLAIVARPELAALAEMFRAPCGPRPHVAALSGPPGSGKTTLVCELARCARQQGFIPIASRLIGARYADLWRGRSLFIVHDRDDTTGWSSFLQAAMTAAQPHVLLLVGAKEARGVDGLALDRLDTESLIAAIRPETERPDARMASFVRHAAHRARGVPGRFVQILWPGSMLDRDGASPGQASTSRAAERAAVYGSQQDAGVAVRDSCDPSPVVCTWPAPGELAALRRRVEAARAQLANGRHAPGIRHLRQAVGSLARRAGWSDAAEGALALGSALLRRGRVRDAQSVLEEAEGYASRAGADRLLVDIATLCGDGWVDLARLDEGERVLAAALAAARAAGDGGRSGIAALSLARCLFWQGQYADAQVVLGAQPEGAAAHALRHARLASRLAVAQSDLRSAMSIIADAKHRCRADADPDATAAIASAAAFVHLAVGDLDAVDHDVAEAVAAARSMHDPLRALKARLLLAEAERRRGRKASAQSQLDRLKRMAVTMPPIVRARLDLSLALAGGADAREPLRRLVASTGLAALALYVPQDRGTQAGAHSSEPVGSDVGDLVSILRACQTAEDEATVLKEVLARVREQLHAAAVAFVRCQNGRTDVLAGENARLDGDVAERAMAAGIAIAPHRRNDRTEAAAPVQYGGAPIAALWARWTVGSTYDLARATGVLTMAATAAAPVVSAALVRRNHPPVAALSGLLGVTPVMMELRRSIERAAAAPFAVLIDGESGSGKELVARAIHRLGPRRDRAFSTLNCAALPDDLVEAELFGHARGSFTGAVADRPGVFEEAHGGTLFLDEIGELSLRAQAKVLRVIQEGELRRIGENASRRIDVRIVSATNRHLREEVDAGRFRLDLLYRLDVVRVTLPPLRERREDIALLAEHVWREATERVGSRAALSAATVAALARYDWPGNVRELQNVLAALAVRSPKRGVVPPTALPPAFGARRDDETWQLDAARRIFEERFVRAALVRSGGHQGRAAEELGVTRQGLTKLMTRLGITNDDRRLPTADATGGDRR